MVVHSARSVNGIPGLICRTPDLFSQFYCIFTPPFFSLLSPLFWTPLLVLSYSIKLTSPYHTSVSILSFFVLLLFLRVSLFTHQRGPVSLSLKVVIWTARQGKAAPMAAMLEESG